MAYSQFIKNLNKAVKEYHKLYPKPDWDENTLKSLINDFSYHSNKIEGLKMNYGETIQFLTTGMIPNEKLTDGNTLADIRMLTNHQRALKLIFGEYKNKSISLELIKALHKEIMTTSVYELDEMIGPGIFRGSDIGTTRTDGTFKYFISETEIYPQINSLIEKTNERLLTANFDSEDNHPFVIAVDLHVDFLNIHPFRDGNGRTARILMNMINLKYKIPLFSPRSEESLRMNYYNSFNECDEQLNNKPMVMFLGGQLLDMLNLSIKIKKQNNNQKGMSF